MQKLMSNLFLTMIMLGIMAIPGCIEFGTGIPVTIVLIAGGSLGMVVMAKTGYRWEEYEDF